MFVRDLMEKSPKVIHPEATITEAAQIMKHGDLGAIPVCDGTQLVGMVTDRDIVVRGLAGEENIGDLVIRDVMTEDIVTCSEDDSIEDVQELMGDRQIRRVPVLDKDNMLVGILSLGDLAREADATDTDETLSEISQPSHTEPAASLRH